MVAVDAGHRGAPGVDDDGVAVGLVVALRVPRGARGDDVGLGVEGAGLSVMQQATACWRVLGSPPTA